MSGPKYHKGITYHMQGDRVTYMAKGSRYTYIKSSGALYMTTGEGPTGRVSGPESEKTRVQEFLASLRTSASSESSSGPSGAQGPTNRQATSTGGGMNYMDRRMQELAKHRFEHPDPNCPTNMNFGI